jgi:hypothetical protein
MLVMLALLGTALEAQAATPILAFAQTAGGEVAEVVTTTNPLLVSDVGLPTPAFGSTAVTGRVDRTKVQAMHAKAPTTKPEATQAAAPVEVEGNSQALTVADAPIADEVDDEDTRSADEIAEEASVYARLFADSELIAPPKVVAPTPEVRAVPLWAWPVGLVGLGMLVWSRKKAQGQIDAHMPAINVLGRSALSRDGQLAVVEVADGCGGTRRLLIGFGGGAPRLVADLWADPGLGIDLSMEPETLEASAPAVALEIEEPLPAPAAAAKASSPVILAWERALSEAQKVTRPLRKAPAASDTQADIDMSARAQDRNDLIDEVLKNRAQVRGDEQAYQNVGGLSRRGVLA